MALQGDSKMITLSDGIQHTFDEVIFACHADQALALLAEPNQSQRDILSDLPYAMNEVVLHTDTHVLPKRKLAWASWNYLIKGV